MAPFVILGAIVAGVLLAAMLSGPLTVVRHPYHLSYGLRLRDGLLIVVLYCVAICGTLLCSHYRPVRTFGIVNVIAIAVIAWLTADGFASVWCGWAAVSSGAIAARMRFLPPHHHIVHALA